MSSHEKYLRAKVAERYPDAHAYANWEFEYHEKAGVLFGFGYVAIQPNSEDNKKYPHSRFWKIAMTDGDALYSDGNVIESKFIGKEDYNLQGVKDNTLHSLKYYYKVLSKNHK